MYKRITTYAGVALVLFICSVSLAYGSPKPSQTVRTCEVVDFEAFRRRYSAAKRAQDLHIGDSRTLRMIYFLPKDRPFRQSVVDSIKAVIRHSQTFFAAQMQAHGHGNMSFRFETDAQDKPMVHRLVGQHPDRFYSDGGQIWDEIFNVFDAAANNVYFGVFDLGSNAHIGVFGWWVAGKGGGDRDGGVLYVPSEFSWQMVAHELGHAFGLEHDFRDDRYIMSYGFDQRRRLSGCAAEFLSVHPSLNPDIADREAPRPTIELLSSSEYPTGATTARIQLKVSAPNGIHQVILFVKTILPHGGAGFNEIKVCRGLNGERVAIVEFDYDGEIPSAGDTVYGSTSLSDLVEHEITVEGIDTHGYDGHSQFLLSDDSVRPDNVTLVRQSWNRSVAFSPDGTILAAGTDNGLVTLWDVATYEELATLKVQKSSSPSVAFSPDGAILAAADNGTVTLWDVATHEELATLEGHTGNRIGNGAAFSPDGKILASGGNNGMLELWDVTTHGKLTTLEAHTGWVRSVAYSPDGAILASSGGDGTIKLWDAATHGKLATLRAHTDWVHTVAFSPDGTILASTGDGTVELWDVATHGKLATIEGHTDDVYSVAFSTDGTIIASGGGDGKVKLWDVETYRDIATFFKRNMGVMSVAFSPTDRVLASAYLHGSVLLWDVSKYTSSDLWSVGSNADAVLSLDLIPDGGTGNQRDDGVTSGTVSGKGTKIAVEVFALGVKTPLAGLLLKFDFDSSILNLVKAENGAFAFSIPQASGTYFAATEYVKLPASGFLARGEFQTLADVTDREFSIGLEVVKLAESTTAANDVKTTKVISFNTTPDVATFSLSLDADAAAGNQGVTTFDVTIGAIVPIQLFGNGIRSVEGVSARFEYEPAQVGYVGFDPGDVLPNAQVLAVPGTNPTAIDISVVSFGGSAAADSGMVGSIRFRTTDAFSGTTLELVHAEIGRGTERESITPTDVGVTLQPGQPTPDFNGDGRVDFGDFLAFGNRFGARRGDQRYEAKYDLDGDGTIGFGDFLIFGQEFGRTVGS